jgi:hypothetical protein
MALPLVAISLPRAPDMLALCVAEDGTRALATLCNLKTIQMPERCHEFNHRERRQRGWGGWGERENGCFCSPLSTFCIEVDLADPEDGAATTARYPS